MASGFTGAKENFFGWLFKRTSDPIENLSFSAPNENDGGVTTIAAPVAGVLGTVSDLDQGIRTDYEMISRYREMAFHPEIDTAIDEITNEAVSSAGDSEDTVKIILDDLNQPPAIKAAIENAFETIKELLDIRHHAYDIFRRWYVDGRLYFHVIIDPKHPELGIKELRIIDPRKIRKVREIEKVRVKNGVAGGGNSYAILTRVKSEYFIYVDTGFQGVGPTDQPAFGPNTGVKISRDSIIYVTSGLVDSGGVRVLGYLHTAIKPLNQLRILEDATIIFRMSRAPERRVWKIEVGNLPKMKAEQYVRDIMVKHKNRLNYNAADGSVVDDRKFQTILEDYWLPTRNGVGTQVQVLPPGQAFGSEDLMYFLKRLYAALRIPTDRLNGDNQVNYPGAASAMSVSEIKFGKFIARIRLRFSQLFLNALEKQLVLTNVMSIEDWAKISPYIRFDFIKDNYYMEIKDQQILQMRIDLLNNAMPFVGMFWSKDFVRRSILKQTNEDIEREDALIQLEGPPVVLADQGSSTTGGTGKSMMGGASPTNQPELQTKAMSNKKGGDFKQVSKLLSKNT